MKSVMLASHPLACPAEPCYGSPVPKCEGEQQIDCKALPECRGSSCSTLRR